MKLYVPNPQLWVEYFEDMSKGSSNQRGGGRRPRIIAVKPPSKTTEDGTLSIKAVLPTAQTVAQAKSELERADINPKRVEKAFQTSSKRRGESTKRTGETIPSSKRKRQRTKSSQPAVGKGKRRTKAHRDIFVIE